MDQRLKLSIGAWKIEPPEQPPKPEIQSEGPVEANVKAQASAMADDATTLASGSLAEIYQVLKRHEETPRDLAVEVRLLYQNLPEKDRQRLEALRSRTIAKLAIFLPARFGCWRRISRRLSGPHPKLTTGRQTWLLMFLETTPARRSRQPR